MFKMKYIRFLIVIILTALSSFRMKKLEKHQKHHSSKKLVAKDSCSSEDQLKACCLAWKNEIPSDKSIL